MTQNSTQCPSTSAMPDEKAVATLVHTGLADSIEEAVRIYKGWHGRKMCGNPACRGAVLRTAKGVRRHVLGSNLTDTERVALMVTPKEA